MNIACSTCLESFTSGCDISTTPCGHVFHTGCITRWLNRNNDCSQCRKNCDIRQIIKLYFSESQSALEGQITINDLEQKCLKLEEKSQICDQEVSTMKKIVDDCALERNQTDQKCKKLEHEKLLMKLDWSKVEWNLKESINNANKQIKDLKNECKILEQEKWQIKSDLSKTEWILIDSINKANKQIKGLEKEINDQKMDDIRDLQICGFGPVLNKRKRKDCSITIKKVKGSDDGKLILDIIDNFTRILNGLRMGIKSTHVLYNDYQDFWEYYLRKLSTLPNNEAHVAKLEKWFNILNNMNDKFNLMKGNLRFGQLTDNQVREMYTDFDNANDNIKKISITHNGNESDSELLDDVEENGGFGNTAKPDKVDAMSNDNDAEDVMPTIKVGNKEITLTDVNEDIINQMTAEEKDIYIQKFQDYYPFIND